MKKNTSTFANKALLIKISITFLCLVIYRLGANLPVPGLDKVGVQFAKTSPQSSSGSVLNLLSGGALSNFAVFALGITPYISASIVLQLLSGLIPSLNQGANAEPGAHRKVTQYTRYLAIFLSVLAATGLVETLHKKSNVLFLNQQVDLLANHSWGNNLLLILVFTTGFVLTMFIGEIITKKGLGNGASVLVLSGIVASSPQQLKNSFSAANFASFVFICMLVLFAFSVVLWAEFAEKRLPIVSTKTAAFSTLNKESYLPLKLNKAGVMPAIFASSIVGLLALVPSWLPNHGFLFSFKTFLKNTIDHPASLPYVIMLGFFIVVFSYVYNAISFNAEDLAIDLQKKSAFIPGIQPGKDTAFYLNKTNKRLTLLGAMLTSFVAFLPSVVLNVAHVPNFPFAGVSLLIVVVVLVDMIRQVRAELSVSSYKKLLPNFNANFNTTA